MPDGSKELELAMKAAKKLVEDWGREMAKIAAELDKAAKDADAKKAQAQAEKDADAANKDLQRKLLSLKLPPPPPDPKQALKLPDFITKNISENGVKIGDYGSIKPDIDFDVKKMKFQKVGVTVTWEW